MIAHKQRTAKPYQPFVTCHPLAVRTQLQLFCFQTHNGTVSKEKETQPGSVVVSLTAKNTPYAVVSCKFLVRRR